MPVLMTRNIMKICLYIRPYFVLTQIGLYSFFEWSILQNSITLKLVVWKKMVLMASRYFFI